MEEDGMQQGQGRKLPAKQLGIIAVAVIVIAAAYFSGAWKAPFEISTGEAKMLVIGEISPGMKAVLDNDSSLVYYRMQDASQLNVNPGEQLGQYGIVLLDQHLGETFYDHSISRQLGEALQNFVRTGGKLVVVMDSGVYSSGPNNSIASDVAKWEANLGDIMPVECDTTATGIGSCSMPISVQGSIIRAEIDHRIMEGIESAPAVYTDYGEQVIYTFTTFNVRPVGDVVAVILEDSTNRTLPAIVEKKKLLGKTIYFNYDPGMTPGILQNTLEYLR